jgi:hypothetical protein
MQGVPTMSRIKQTREMLKKVGLYSGCAVDVISRDTISRLEGDMLLSQLSAYQGAIERMMKSNPGDVWDPEVNVRFSQLVQKELAALDADKEGS